MKLLLVNITDPRKEKLVSDILNEIEGVEVRSAPSASAKAPRVAKGVAKAPSASESKDVKAAKRRAMRTTTTRRTKRVKSMTPQEEKFMKGLTQAFKEMNEHIAGKRKLKSLKEVLDEL